MTSSIAGPSIPSSSVTARAIASSLASIRSQASRVEAWNASAVAAIAGSPSRVQRSSMRSPAGPVYSLPAIDACTALA